MRSSDFLWLKESCCRQRIPADPLQQELKGHGCYRFNKALILRDNSVFKHLSNSTFIHSPVIISQTTGAIALCAHVRVSGCVCVFISPL